MISNSPTRRNTSSNVMAVLSPSFSCSKFMNPGFHAAMNARPSGQRYQQSFFQFVNRNECDFPVKDEFHSDGIAPIPELAQATHEPNTTCGQVTLFDVPRPACRVHQPLI